MEWINVTSLRRRSGKWGTQPSLLMQRTAGPSLRSEAVTLLIFRVESSSFKRICHPACPGLPWDRSRAQWSDLRFFCPSDLTAPHKSDRPPLCHPERSRGICSAPGSLTKVFPLVLPQNRHAERSAPPIDRVIQRLWRGVEGPRRCLSNPCCSELFNHRARTGRAPLRFTLGPRTKNWLASCYVRRLHLHSRQPDPVVGLRWSKSFEQRGLDKHRRGPSTPRHKRCVTRSIGEALHSG
jgi:hypothetical protein